MWALPKVISFLVWIRRLKLCELSKILILKSELPDFSLYLLISVASSKSTKQAFFEKYTNEQNNFEINLPILGRHIFCGCFSHLKLARLDVDWELCVVHGAHEANSRRDDVKYFVPHTHPQSLGRDRKG